MIIGMAVCNFCHDAFSTFCCKDSQAEKKTLISPCDASRVRLHMRLRVNIENPQDHKSAKIAHSVQGSQTNVAKTYLNMQHIHFEALYVLSIHVHLCLHVTLSHRGLRSLIHGNARWRRAKTSRNS